VGDGPLPLPGPLRELLPLPGAPLEGVRVDGDRLRVPLRRREPHARAGPRGLPAPGRPALWGSVGRSASPVPRTPPVGQSRSAATRARADRVRELEADGASLREMNDGEALARERLAHKLREGRLVAYQYHGLPRPRGTADPVEDRGRHVPGG